MFCKKSAVARYYAYIALTLNIFIILRLSLSHAQIAKNYDPSVINFDLQTMTSNRDEMDIYLIRGSLSH